MKTAVFTIGSRNYFAHVKTLMASLAETNPEWDRFAAIADSIQFLEADGFTLLAPEDIDLPHLHQMAFRYSIMEFNTAIKPFVFKTLLTKLGYDRVIYLDPDIYVYDRMNELEEAFEKGNSIILTPHMTGINSDDKKPTDVDILLSGTYNLGFLGLAKSEETFEFLEWWSKKLEKLCFIAHASGIFVDQKWVDLVPGFFENVYILRHEGYNTAYWNLAHRKPEKREGKFYYNGKPLIFFHFSGINITNLYNVSKHQDRFTIDDLGLTRELYESYASTVLHNGHAMYKMMPYAFGTFDNGDIVSDHHRVIYREHSRIQQMCGENPFEKFEIFATIDYIEKNALSAQCGINVDGLQKRLMKFKNYFNVMNKWIKLSNAAASIENYLVAHDYTRIAVYGMGELGERLHEALKDSKQITIAYGIDKTKKVSEDNFVIYDPNDKLPEVDAIIVSATFDFNAIKKSLSEKVNYPIISLEEVIMRCSDI